MRILYVNHTSTVSGAERSLLELIGGLPPGVEPSVACPPGPLAERVRALGTAHDPIRGTDGSWKVHPWHTTRALAEMALDSVRVRTIARRTRADVIHANSIRSGLVAVPAARASGSASVVHLRDALPSGTVSAGVRRLLAGGATALIANSGYTAERFGPEQLPAAAHVVHNPVDLERFHPDRVDAANARARLGLAPQALALAVLGQLTPWKAQDDAVRILGALRERGIDAHLLLIGSVKFAAKATRYDNPSYVRALEDLIADLDLSDRVSFLGEREDVPELLSAVDVALVPSWEEPFGRAVAEGMAMGVPVAATSVGGPPELIDDGVDGLLLPPREPGAWVDPLARLLEDESRREQMGQAALRRASATLGVRQHVESVLEVYREALGRPGADVPSAGGTPARNGRFQPAEERLRS